jgi:hypothetical protein
MFLLHALFRSGVLGAAGANAQLVFNVKGEDLLFLDQPNVGLTAAFTPLVLPALSAAGRGTVAVLDMGGRARGE